MPEEELDDLFRKSASEFRPEYDPAAWQAMEEKLDAYRPYPGSWQRFIWLSSLLLIMGLGFGVSLLLQHHQRQQAGSQVAAPAPVLQAPVPASKDILLQAPAPVGSKEIGQKQIALPKQPDQQQQDQQQPNRQQQNQQQQNRQQQNRQEQTIRQTASQALTPGSRALRRQAFARQTGLLPASRRPQDPQRQTLVEAPGLQQAPASLLLPDTSGPGQANPAADKLQVAAAPGLPEKNVKPDSLAQALPPVPGPAADSSAVEKSKGPLLSRFSLRLMAAPDLSAVGLRKPEGVGSSAGLELRYQLLPRWYLTAGLLKSHKKYGARPEDYGDSRYWYNYHLPDDISAVCEVLDLPIQVGYQVVSGQRSAFTIHTGLSSYWMLSEDYRYIYTTGNPYTRNLSVRGQNRHLFSIYNLSGYYARRLTPALEAGIEPFVKLPLAGVGAGKIKLSSAGVYLSLGYRLR